MTTEAATIDTSKLTGLTLKHGAHETRDAGMCAMEAVAWLAGEPHADHPKCACPVIGAAMRRLNDRIPYDDVRTELLVPLLPRLVGSRSTPKVQTKRAYLAADFAVRVAAPIALEKAKKPELAAELRAVPEIVDRTSAEKARPVAWSVRGKAYAYADAAAAAAAYTAYAAAAAYAYTAAAYAAAAYAADAADAAAAYAADAYAYAAAAEQIEAAKKAARIEVYREGVKLIERMLSVT